VDTLSLRDVRRLALARAGLLRPEWTGLPARAPRGDTRCREAVQRVIERFGYLQLDTVSVAGARSHALVLLSRLEGMDADLGEDLLRPGGSLFEYWGHEACWLPVDLYPVLGFRRKAYKRHPWWGDVLKENRAAARQLLKRVHDDGPLRSKDLAESSGGGWWNHGTGKQLLSALWSSGELAIRERRKFQRVYDLPERVHPELLAEQPLPTPEAFRVLLLRALDGHGWATAKTLAATWRLRRREGSTTQALKELEERGEIVSCALEIKGEKPQRGWVRPSDLDLAARLRRARPRTDRGVLLSPFDPVLWDRERVELLFEFFQRIEIYTPAAKRRFGYFCLPVLAGERLVGRVDLKADRDRGVLRVLSRHFERSGSGSSSDREAMRTALERHAAAVGLQLEEA
jgi:uncharacterized protein YcaQ